MKAYSLIIKSVFAVGLLAASGVSFAVPIIEGMIGMGGDFTPVNSSGVTGLGSATGIDFSFDEFQVSPASGDFAGLLDDTGTITDLQFNPFNGPIVDFWTVGGFSFELTSLYEIPRPPSFASPFLTLTGEGIIRHDDYQDTLGIWTFGGTAGGNWTAGGWTFGGTGGGGTFSGRKQARG